jgi:hypothetical protein
MRLSAREATSIAVAVLFWGIVVMTILGGWR